MTPSKSPQEPSAPPTPPAASGDRRCWPMLLVGWVLCGLIVLIFFGFKLFSYRPLFGDEHIYYYMAKIMIQGKAMPYRDFFFAHPPVQLLLVAGLFKVFGASFVVAKSVAPLSTVASGVATFAIGRRCLGLFPALLATAAFLGSYHVLRVSSHYTGGNLALALIMCGVWMLFLRRDVWGAILLALSAHTAVYSGPPIIMILGLLFLYEPKRAFRVIAIVSGVYFAITVVFLVIAGWDYIEGVFSYHFMKKPKANDAWDAKLNYLSKNFLFHNFYLTWSVVVALFCVLWRRTEASAIPIAPASPPREDRPKSKRRKRKKPKRDHRRETRATGGMMRRWQGLVAFSQTRRGFVVLLLLFYAGNFAWQMKLTEWYDYYFLILYPTAGLLLGYAVTEIFISAFAAFRDRRWLMLVRSLSICAMIALGYVAVRKSQLEQYYPNYKPGQQVRSQKYVWHDAPGLGPINAWYRAIFWEDQRDPKREYPPQTFYLWHEMRHLEDLDKLVGYVREHSRPEDRLFGESGMAPLVAFLADRDLVAYLADTNTKRVTSGQISRKAMRAKIDVPELRYVIASRKGRKGRYRYLKASEIPGLDANFKLVHEYTSASNRGYVWQILERKTPREPTP